MGYSMRCIHEGDYIDFRKCFSCSRFTCYENGSVNCSFNKTNEDKRGFKKAYNDARFREKIIIHK